MQSVLGLVQSVLGLGLGIPGLILSLSFAIPTLVLDPDVKASFPLYGSRGCKQKVS